MSGDLTGEDAFDKLLEAAMDSHFNARQATERQHAAEARAKEAEGVAIDAQAQVRFLRLEKETALPKLAELWQAAKDASDYRTTAGAKDGAEIATIMKRLRTALEAASGHCDEIPF